MEDVSELKSKVSALESENQSLKDVIEQLDAQCKAFDQTIIEVLKSNIVLKSNCLLLENKENRLKDEINALSAVIEKSQVNNVEDDENKIPDGTRWE